APSSTVSAIQLPGPGSAVMVAGGMAVFGPPGGPGSNAGRTGPCPAASGASGTSAAAGSPCAALHPDSAIAVPAASIDNIDRLSIATPITSQRYREDLPTCCYALGTLPAQVTNPANRHAGEAVCARPLSGHLPMSLRRRTVPTAGAGPTQPGPGDRGLPPNARRSPSGSAGSPPAQGTIRRRLVEHHRRLATGNGRAARYRPRTRIVGGSKRCISSTSEVNTVTRPCCRLATTARTASIAYLCPCNPTSPSNR